MKNILQNFLYVSVILIGSTLLQADESIPDDFQLRLGGYFVADQDTDIRLSHSGVGVTMNLQDTFEMDTQGQVFRLDGYYRFSPKHSIEVAWYAIHNSSSTTKDFVWDDLNISNKGHLNTFFNTDIYKVNYVYSFYHSDQVELGLAAGLHITKIDIGFDGSYKSDGVDTNSKEEVGVTAPLPIVGVRLNYKILPTLSVKYSVDYFFITFEGAAGSMSDAMLTLDYRVFDNFGLGIGYNSTRMRFKADVGDKGELKLNHDVSGGLIYATVNF
jgi:hypothetical protein